MLTSLHKKAAYIGLFAAFLLQMQYAHALSIGGWKPLKSLEKTITAPTETLINSVKAVTGQGSYSAILDPFKDAAASYAPVPPLAADVATWATSKIYKEAQSAAQKTGSTGAFVFDVAAFSGQYLNAITQAAGQSAGNILAGQNPFQIVGAPLAAAINQARERHYPQSKPLPNDVKKGLASLYPKEVLDRARYTIGKIEITLPNGIGKTQKLFGNDFAVVADDVIVFSSDPGSFWDNPFFWGHEVAHVQQYKNWGVSDFAFRYIKNFKSIESDADTLGNSALNWAKSNQYAQGVKMNSQAMLSHALNIQGEAQPLLPKEYAQLQQPHIEDPAVVRLYFPADSAALEYYGTRNGRIVVVDNFQKIWMHIGWALPPDIPGPAWVYFIPGYGSYDVMYNGAVLLRYTRPFGPNGPLGPPAQVGYSHRIQ